jgi:starch synthase/alpha-amylase
MEKAVDRKTVPKILIVTPEVTYLPDRMGSFSDCLTAKAGGLADVSASLVCELFRQGADIHVAIPNYKAIFDDCLTSFLQKEQTALRRVMPKDRLHLAEDRTFAHRQNIYSGDGEDNMKLALAFQREVINNIIPRVGPDLIHCNDWMTGLIPALARIAGIPCLFTLYNIYSMKTSLAGIEDRGIDVQYFWNHLYYDRMPGGYEESRHANPVELLTSGVFAAHFVNVVSPTFLQEIVMGQHDFVGLPLQQELRNKLNVDNNCGNGFLFETYDSNGLFWAIDQAMHFYMMPVDVKRKQIQRIMRLGAEMFNYKVTAKEYIRLYEKMLQSPVIPTE